MQARSGSGRKRMEVGTLGKYDLLVWGKSRVLMLKRPPGLGITAAAAMGWLAGGTGFPHLGSKRELKFALEAYWDGQLSEEGLREQARQVGGSGMMEDTGMGRPGGWLGG